MLLRNPHADIQFQGPVYLGPGFSLHMPDGGTFIVGPAVEFRRGFRAEIGPRGRLTIGGGSHLTFDVLMQCQTRIEIGERAMFGQATVVTDGVRIDDDATITTKCTITSDVGRRAFIGANSVVSDPIPAYCVAVGAPAQVVDYFGPPGQEPPGWEPREPAGNSSHE